MSVLNPHSGAGLDAATIKFGVTSKEKEQTNVQGAIGRRAPGRLVTSSVDFAGS